MYVDAAGDKEISTDTDKEVGTDTEDNSQG